jgi:hypothetical protein
LMHMRDISQAGSLKFCHVPHAMGRIRLRGHQ